MMRVLPGKQRGVVLLCSKEIMKGGKRASMWGQVSDRLLTQKIRSAQCVYNELSPGLGQ